MLEGRGISHGFRRGQSVLAGVDLVVPHGAVLAIVGRSGCGKSTLLHILSGLMTPREGGVTVRGRPVRGPSPDRVMMFQSPSLFPWMTVWQNAELGLRFGGRRTTAKHRVPQILDLVELSHLADRNVQDLSGGQQQRVALARSLVPEPDILFLDEPFSALDAFTRRGLQHDMRRIAREMRLTVVLVTHDVAEAVAMADRVVLLASDPGRIAADTATALAEDERQDTGRAFAAEVTRVETLYAEIAGVGAALPGTRPLRHASQEMPQ